MSGLNLFFCSYPEDVNSYLPSFLRRFFVVKSFYFAQLLIYFPLA